jgi:Flp pilus assembly pilin Flp
MSGRLGGGVARRWIRRRERGAVAVEFALVLPILVMLLVGTITSGLSYSQALGITNAVREGSRFGAIADGSHVDWGSDVVARVRQTQFDDPGLETSVRVELWNGGSLVNSYDHAAAGPGVDATDLARFEVPTVPAGVCVVRVVATRNFTIQAPPLMPAIVDRKMGRGSVARYEGATC